jgi:hypothetical protein
MTSTEAHSAHDAAAKKAIEENIEQYGCHLALLAPTDYLPGFAYSISLYQKFQHPELICFGLDQDVLGAVLNHACDLIKAGERLMPGVEYAGFLEGYKIQFIEVDRDYYPNYVGYGCWYYGLTMDFPLYQLVWPDKENHFPWDDGFNPNWKRKQPLLDRNTDFKFYEERNLGVFTTKQAFSGDPILYVYHNASGDWQFHTTESPDLDDTILVCLEEFTKLDPTLNDTYHLDYGWRAWRVSKEAEWEWEQGREGDEK